MPPFKKMIDFSLAWGRQFKSQLFLLTRNQFQSKRYFPLLRGKQQIEELNTKIVQQGPFISKQSHSIPLRNKIFPEEKFLPNFFSVQKEKGNENKQYQLHTYRFKAKSQTPKAICILFHGLNWHSNLLAHIAEHFAFKGIEVCAFDFKGFGKSEGLRGFLPDMESHLKDSEAFVNEIKQLYGSSIPIFLCGFSLGGLTAFHLGLQTPKAFNGIIFLAPALKDHPHYQKYPKMIGRFIGRLFPKLRVTRPKGRRSISQRNSKVDKLFEKDEHYYKEGLRAGTLRSLCETMIDTTELFSKFSVPFLLFQGGQDKLVDPNVAQLMQNQSISQDKEIIFNPTMWHGIPLEPEIDEYMEKAANWILARI